MSYLWLASTRSRNLLYGFIFYFVIQFKTKICSFQDNYIISVKLHPAPCPHVENPLIYRNVEPQRRTSEQLVKWTIKWAIGREND